jgi:regulator-associated protein of mTOR
MVPPTQPHDKKSIIDHDDGDDDEPSDNLVAGGYSETNFYNWSCKYFANSLMKQPEDCDPFSERYLQREYRFLRNHTIRDEAFALTDYYDKAKFSDQIFVNKENNSPHKLLFHPYISQLTVFHKSSWSTWDIEQGTKLCTHSNNSPNSSKITAAEFINPHDVTFLLVGTDDGCVRIWKDYSDECMTTPSLISSWKALGDMEQGSKNVGMVLEWEQPTGLLYATGDVRHIGVWDTHKEMKIQDILTGADCCLTSLALDDCQRSLMVAGCGDGTVRLYDRRHPSASSLVNVLSEHKNWVLSVHIQQPLNNILSMSVNGDVKVWDPRFTKSTRTFTTLNGTNACSFHHSVPLLAWSVLP